MFRIEEAAGLHQDSLLLLCSVGSAIIKDELVDGELLLIPSAEKPNSLGIISRGLFDRRPYVALVYMDLARLREVEVIPPGVAIMADEINWLPP